MGSKTEYFYQYKTYCKGWWRGMTVIDLLTTNYSNRTREYFLKALAVGAITVNDQIVSEHYIFKDHDCLKHIVHQHEPEQPDIEILYEDNEITVVNKPNGIPVHPVGPYHFYTVTKTVFGEKNVGCVNRLDMPVSGVVIVNTCGKKKVHKKLSTATKIYLAKVEGHFTLTDEKIAELEVEKIVVGDKVTYKVDKPIGTDKAHKTRMIVEKEGKEAQTLFELVEYKNGKSIVLCQPITGRTHQIRVHLAHLGFPIVGDILYGNGEDVEFEAPYDCKANIEEYENKELYEFIKKNCPGSYNRTFAKMDKIICLHAWKYKYNDQEFVAPPPAWTELTDDSLTPQ